jgi:hypothetical protein
MTKRPRMCAHVIHDIVSCSGLGVEAMNELCTAITLNNRAVAQAFANNDGNLTFSLSPLQEALHAMKSFSATISTVFGDTLATADDDHGLPCVGFGFTSDYPSSLGGIMREYGLVYNRPLLLPWELRISSPGELEAFGFTVSTTLLFNLALAWHDLGMKTGREVAYIKAGKLYDLVAVILDHSDILDESHGVLKCMVLNNRAEIHHHLGDYEKSRTCVTDMFDLLVLEDNFDLLLGSSEAKTLRLNLCHFTTPNVALAA